MIQKFVLINLMNTSKTKNNDDKATFSKAKAIDDGHNNSYYNDDSDNKYNVDENT